MSGLGPNPNSCLLRLSARHFVAIPVAVVVVVAVILFERSSSSSRATHKVDADAAAFQ